MEGLDQTQIDEKQMSAYREKLKQAKEDLAKYRDIGALIISEQSVALINRYHVERASTSVHQDDWFGQVREHYDAAEKCLVELLIEAKKDLINK